jgi:hypothetical protein
MTQEELDAIDKRREESYLEIRKEINKKHLVGLYQRLIEEEQNDIIKKRYYKDMLSAFLIEDDQEHEAVRKEVNRFWNRLETRKETYTNRIEYLMEAVEYLRELAAEAGTPSTSIQRRIDIVRDVNSKDFLSAIRPRIVKRVKNNLKY